MALPIFTLAYGFLTTFVLTSLARNRRDSRPDARILTLLGHGLMAASATGGCLALSAAAMASLGY